MNDVDLSQNRVEGGFFLLNSGSAAPYDWPKDDGGAYRLVGTYKDSGSPLRDALIELIREAKHRLFVASFMIGDEAVIAEVIRAAERLRGGVYVITALDDRSLRRGLQEYDDEDLEAPEERGKCFERLTTKGVYVRGHESCHAKFALADGTVALVGSANFVKKGFDWTGEADLIIRDRVQVQQLARLFTELWYEGCLWEVPPGQTYIVAERVAQKPPVRPETPRGRPGEIVWTSGDGNTSLLRAIQDTIGTAAERLTLSTYSLVGMGDAPSLLFDPLSRAVDRGVEVRLFIRQRNAFPQQTHDLLVLDDMGIRIHGDTRNHAKAVLADGRVGVVFSANFDADHGLQSGVEVGVVLPDEAVAGHVLRYLDHAMDNADTRFVRNPTLAELDGRLAARWCKECELPPRVLIRASRGDWRAVVSATSQGPVLYEQENKVTSRLYAGDKRIDLHATDGAYRLEIHPDGVGVAKRLDEWLRSVRRAEVAGARGFCASRLEWEKEEGSEC